MIIMDLPFPNSANTHWRNARGVTYISKQGLAYREAVALSAKLYGLKADNKRLEISVQLYAPNKRAYDIDNRIKPLLDALQYAGVIDNDGLVDKLIVERMPIVKDGKCRVFINAYRNDDEHQGQQEGG